MKTSRKNKACSILFSFALFAFTVATSDLFSAGPETQVKASANPMAIKANGPSYLTNLDALEAKEEDTPQPAEACPGSPAAMRVGTVCDSSPSSSQRRPDSQFFPSSQKSSSIQTSDQRKDDGEGLPAPVAMGKKSRFKYERIENESKPISGNIVEVYPEMSTLVYLSNSDINRIKCSNGDVKDVVYSDEKGVKVSFSGNSAFVKYLIGQNQITQAKIYADVPTDFHIVCSDNTIYTIIGVPKKIPPQTVQLMNTKDKVKENVDLFGSTSIENKIGKIIRYAYNDEYPSTFDVQEINKHLDIFEKIDLYLKRKITVSGEGVTLKEFILTIRPQFTNEKRIVLSEKHFLIPEITKEPYAIGLEPVPLEGTNKVRLFIVEKSVGNS